MTLAGRERWIPYLFLAPVFALLVIFRLLPAVFGMRESLYSSFLGVERFVGLDNFAFIFADPIFWESVSVTLIFSVIINPLQTALALALALVANQALRGASFLRSVWLLPGRGIDQRDRADLGPDARHGRRPHQRHPHPSGRGPIPG